MAKKPSEDGGCLDDLLQCMICFGPFTNPKMLTCGHTFCLECLQSDHNASQQAGRCPIGKIRCSVCRKETQIPSSGVAGLPNDFKVNKIKEAMQQNKKCNRRRTNRCNPCATRNKTIDATVYCVECNTNYCKQCVRIHRKNAAFKGHTVIDKSKQLDLNTTDPPCQIHEDEDSHYFCQRCKTIVCQTCIIEVHGDHDVIPIQVACDQLKQTFSKLEPVIAEKVRRRSDTITHLKANESSLLQSCREAQSAIKNRASQMITSIHKQETQLLSQLSQIQDKKCLAIRKNMPELERYLKEAQHAQDLLHSTKMATHPQMLVNSDDLVTKMRELAEDNEDNKDDVKPMVVKFLTDTRDPTIGSIDREVVTLVQHPFACQGKEGKHDDNKGCPICLEPFDNPIELLNCNHKFCAGCLISSFAVKQECPICRTGHGKIYGTMPKDATMTVIRAEWSLPGYESCGTIIVQYNIPSGIQTAEHPHPGVPYKGAQRHGLLPDNRQGNNVLRLLKQAFEQRLTFTVGRSVITGKDNVVTWNDIHHKTSVEGGPTEFGYPDPDYLDRVTEDLAEKGIK